MKKYALALDLIDDVKLIQQYEDWHKDVNFWKEIKASIFDSGVINMEIFRTNTRLFMIMETKDGFELLKKEKMDIDNIIVQDWEKLMWKFQKPLPWANGGEKWVLMDRIFKLSEHL